MIINSRSPYFIIVNETGQVGSKIDLFLWNNGTTKPTSPTYTLSKRSPSSTQLETAYNISTLIQEYIDNIAPTESNNSMWCNVEVKRYKETSFDSYTLLNTVTHIGVNGYTKYLDGYNKTNSSNAFVVLADNTKEIQYSLGSIPFVNVMVNTTLGDKVDIVYKDLKGRNEATDILIATTDVATTNMLKIDLSTSLVKYNCGNTLTINYSSGGSLVSSVTFRVIPICETKYTPVICSFINRYGGWQFLNFFKAQTNTINTEYTTHKFVSASVNYNIKVGQKTVLNVNGIQMVMLNTGWVDENYSDLIEDLLLSQTILLDGKPAICKTSGTNLKTSLMDKNINYTIEFELSYDLINNSI
jgi:hypothetical protein